MGKNVGILKVGAGVKQVCVMSSMLFNLNVHAFVNMKEYKVSRTETKWSYVWQVHFLVMD